MKALQLIHCRSPCCQTLLLRRNVCGQSMAASWTNNSHSACRTNCELLYKEPTASPDAAKQQGEDYISSSRDIVTTRPTNHSRYNDEDLYLEDQGKGNGPVRGAADVEGNTFANVAGTSVTDHAKLRNKSRADDPIHIHGNDKLRTAPVPLAETVTREEAAPRWSPHCRQCEWPLSLVRCSPSWPHLRCQTSGRMPERTLRM